MEEEDEEEVSLKVLLKELEKDFEQKEEASERRKREGSHVYLNVYDMVSLNSYTSWCGIGAFHSGVQVYSREWAYGGHPYSYTGIYDMHPKQENDIVGQGIKFRETLDMGFTSMSETEVKQLILTLGKQYNGNTYHILKKNCNHFSSDLCQKLTGSLTPHWVNRLAYVSSCMPFLLRCIPPSWVTPLEANQTEGRMLFSSYSQSRVHSAMPPDPDPDPDPNPDKEGPT